MSDSAFNWTSKEILAYAQSLINEVKNVPEQLRQSAKFEVSIIKKHKIFYDTYKMAVKTILRYGENFDLNELKTMLELRDKLKAGQISKEDANKEIGQKYYNRFAAPVVAKLQRKNKKK